MRRSFMMGASLAVLALSAALPASAKAPPLSIRNSFRIGSSGVMCTAQNAPGDARLVGMFDRSYRLTCRDAAGAVGTLIAVRRDVVAASEPSAMPGVQVECAAPAKAVIDQLGEVESLACRDPRSRVDYRRYVVRRGGVTYFVEGLAGYDPALRLAVASVVADRPVEGEVRVATTEVSDPAAFARIQAGQLDQLGARDEGYLRNNGGSFAESAEFFEALATRDRSSGNPGLAEALANQGLQQSNLGNFAAAQRLFEDGRKALAPNDGVTERRLRNYRAIDLLNQRKPDAALTELGRPVVPVEISFDRDKLAMGEINMPLSEQINRENDSLRRLGGIDPGLSPVERAEILDAQGVALTGTAARLQGHWPDAAAKFAEAERRLLAVRGGRVVSTGWLRSEIQIEEALLSEAQGRQAEASADFDRAIATIADAFPQSPTLLAAQARKAAFLGRSGDSAGAEALFAKVIDQSAMVPDSGTTLRELLSPYFGLLARDGGAGSAAAMFTAAQVLQRPGVAQTQAVLARELSEGNDDAAALFRLSVARSRDIARTDADVTRLAALTAPTAQEQQALKAAQDTLASLQRDQTELVSKLAAFPRYNVLAPQRVNLAELQQALRPGEAYYKLIAAGDDLYALFATPDDSLTFRIDLDRAKLAAEVQAIRDTIVKVEGGRQVNYPFDLDRSRALYLKLFGPLDAGLAQVRHLVFEPDAAMLQLPPSVLVTDDKGIAAYKKRTQAADADLFDFTGIAWLGRGREVSIAVSPRGFLDIRKLAPSHASRPYLGLGHNAVPQLRPVAAVADECEWPLVTWQRPISADELLFAQKTIGGTSAVHTDAAFSDTALLGDASLDQYRVLHFATHGLVTAPRADCPARPALVTSFGGPGSDGLLSFREIFDLKLDADLVILSACDTAGIASVSASREAGVTTGGNYALDGLVRAFVGAGARSVVASHWPVPDDYDATKRLIGGMIGAAPGKPLAAALADAEQKLMDDPNTSHPFYWAAFIILGDGAKPLVPAVPGAQANPAR
ncbi:CHAT domain-containing protein [Novosphingobium sp. KCTC 2891]|uniref:CHAT domain-containing protein n=1 Tax=Novosphingobium sp. KCTC 2891 TaxID=2989730 RepID=UPI00222192F4|nr:CHAT domain-containing protein [Novosphingobium sp. KCTC 2891]MCW1384842.1 CHAT domain-containing protein [Novosphingobium sp. KCTC 2891]